MVVCLERGVNDLYMVQFIVVAVEITAVAFFMFMFHKVVW